MKEWRIYMLTVGFFLIALALIGQFFILQIVKRSSYEELAANQHQIYQVLAPERGEVFVKDRFFEADDTSQLIPLAVNQELSLAYAVPREVNQPSKVITSLASLLDIEREELIDKLDHKSDPYEPLAHGLTKETVEQIQNLDIDGIYFDKETKRFFPSGSVMADITGFVGYVDNERVGQYGLEGYYNKELSGTTGFLESEKDTQGRLIAAAKRLIQPAEDGEDLILTIDPNVQAFIVKKLKEYNDKLEGEGGTIIVSDPTTGAIRGMTSLPTYDPNNYSAVENLNLFLNPAIQEVFEPGSIFKPITVAIALEKKLITPQTTYEDKGFVKIGETIIRNSHDKPEGIQTMAQVLEKSLNTGVVFVQQLIGQKVFNDYLHKFGLDEKTGIDLSGEASGDLSNLETKRALEYATAAFGQGIAVTPIELVTALSALANKGKMMRPYLVAEFRDKDGRLTTVKPKSLGHIISEETAETMTKMLVGVVENGYGSKTKIPNYFIAGKTGTAQVAGPGGYSDKTIHSFGGFFPAFNPQFFVLVKINNPQTIRFAADSIVPLFREIAKYIIDYYDIKPNN